MKRLIASLLLAGISSLGALLGMSAASAATAPVAPGVVRGLPDFADLVERAAPAVVNIRTAEKARPDSGAGPSVPLPEGLDENDPLYEFFKRFFPPRQSPHPRIPSPGGGEEIPRGQASGFIISADGYILTNHHVVDGADEILVTLTDNREFRGKLVGSDRRTDVALVKIEASNLPRLPIGDTTRLRVGEWVLAIGSPFGLESTVTAGIVSAKGRDTGEYLPFIQTDVAVNPGNSGGPLLNMAGEAVGINSQIYSRTGGFMGISFAIPIDEAMRVADQLRTTGRVVRGRIGVGIAEVTKDVSEPLGLPKAAGAVVRSVDPNGPAERAGLEVGDIITRFAGKTIERSSDLPRMVGSTAPGTKATIQVWRKGALRDLTVTVGEMESEKAASRPGAPSPGAKPKAPVANKLGLVISDLSEERRHELRIRSGVLVDSVDGAAAQAGIRPGDIILAIDNQDVTNAKQFNALVAKLDLRKIHVALVRRGDSAAFVPIRPAK